MACIILFLSVLYSYVSSNLCTRGMRKLFFRDEASLANNFCGFIEFSVTNSVQYSAQCSVQNSVRHIVLFSVDNMVMHNVQQTKGGVPQAISRLAQLSQQLLCMVTG